jgi:hypothetical protein
MTTIPSIDLSALFPQAQPGLLDILKQLQGAQDTANKANEQRYQDVLGQYSGMGQAGMASIGEQEQQGQAKNIQNMTSHGLGNTTMVGANARGIASGAENQRQQLQEQVTAQKAGVMERRTDQGPDMALYANLIQGATAGQQGGKRARTLNGQRVMMTNDEWTQATGYGGRFTQ